MGGFAVIIHQQVAFYSIHEKLWELKFGLFIYSDCVHNVWPYRITVDQEVEQVIY